MRNLSYQVWPNPATDIQMIIYEVLSVSFLQSLPTAFWLLYNSGQLQELLSKNKNSIEEAVEIKLETQDQHFTDLRICLRNNFVYVIPI
uniref:Uncharacterized protein n=1 Tax=Ditylenchus dipsaci TaxID=166011 RepID=A0A915D1G3_9BILA